MLFFLMTLLVLLSVGTSTIVVIRYFDKKLERLNCSILSIAARDIEVPEDVEGIDKFIFDEAKSALWHILTHPQIPASKKWAATQLGSLYELVTFNGQIKKYQYNFSDEMKEYAETVDGETSVRWMGDVMCALANDEAFLESGKEAKLFALKMLMGGSREEDQ